MQHDLLIQQPAAGAQHPTELLLLFHGVGASAQSMQPLAEFLAAQRPGAWVVCVRSPQPSDLGQGWQWFSVQGVTEANRPERVAAAMPAFDAAVRQWQQHTGVNAEHTTLIGFSQGAIMSLEATQSANAVPLAHRVVAVAGRFAQPPRHRPVATAFHLLHGEQDPIMPVVLAVQACAQLEALGASVTLERFDGLGHGIDARVAHAIGRRVQA